MAIAEVSIVPVGTDEPSYSSFVTAALEACAAKGVRHEVGAMSTVLEGDLDAILACARQMHHAVLRSGAQRVVTHLTLEERTDRRDGIERRVAAVGK
jgi:uncharacterized protein (TIGR00106 family)